MRVEKPVYNWKFPLSKPMKGVAGKTGAWRTMRPIVDSSKCTRCYQCEIYCPGICIVVEPDKGAVIDYDYCKGCGICADVCPSNAISIVPESG